MNREILLTIIECIIRLLIIVVGTYLISIIKKYKLEKWVGQAVNAAEQIFDEPGMGAKKKELVLNFIRDKFKFNLSAAELDVLIEAAVSELNKYKLEKITTPFTYSTDE